MKAINRDILKLAVPSILANITVPIVGMADIAVAGHLDATASFQTATLISGIAIGSMLFDLLYWNFFFLRIGTGGMTAQAYGRGDMRECANIFSRAIGLAFAISAVILALQWLCVKAAFLVVDCTPEVRELASQYFFVRIWAAPATLNLIAFKGWFIGMQDSVSSMVTDLVVNGVNIAASIILALGLRVGPVDYPGMGFTGVAAGTVIAQYSGLACAFMLVFMKYRRKVFAGFSLRGFVMAFTGGETRRFFTINSDIFVRSVCFIGIYMGFTALAAHYGDLMLASATILMKLMMIFSYFTDGFAYAGEALTGKYIGMRDRDGVSATVRYTFVWSMGIGVLFMGIYYVSGVPMLRMMTSDPAVVEASEQFLPWLLLMPVAGCAAFAWDGIYIGATASASIRNAMLLATAGFIVTYFAGVEILKGSGLAGTPSFGPAGIHILLLAYFVHLAVRTVWLSVMYRRAILSRIS